MGALCSHLFLVVSGSVHVFVNGIKETAFVFSFLEYIDMPLYLLILDAL